MHDNDDTQNPFSHTPAIILAAAAVIIPAVLAISGESTAATDVVVAAAIAVAAVGYEVIVMLHQTEKLIRGDVRALRALVTMGNALSEHVNLTMDERQVFGDLINTYSVIRGTKDHPTRNRATDAVRRALVELSDLRMGHARIRLGDGLEVLSEYLKDPALCSVWAVSKGHTWSGEEGKAYLALNVEKATTSEYTRSAIPISRIFLEEDLALVATATSTAMATQHSAGIEVYVAHLAKVPHEYRTAFAIFSDRVVVSLNSEVQGEFTIGTSEESDDVARAMKLRFEVLRDTYAIPYSEWTDSDQIP